MNAIDKVISHAGGAAKLARALGVTTQAVCFWRDGRRIFPAEHCPTAEKISEREVTCEQLRPDVDWAYVRGTACIISPPVPTEPAPIELCTQAGRADDRALHAEAAQAGLGPEGQPPRSATDPLTADPALNAELTRAERAGLVKLPNQPKPWDGVERRISTVPRRAADRNRDIAQTGQGS